jgi:ATP-dependent Clp protease ATP-binding subunit ClpA
VISSGRYEASQYGNPHIEREHLLLGLFPEHRRLAQKLLDKKGGVQSLRGEIEFQVKRGERLSTYVEVPLSAESKRILTQKPESWSIARVQATGLEPQSRSAAV